MPAPPPESEPAMASTRGGVTFTVIQLSWQEFGPTRGGYPALPEVRKLHPPHLPAADGHGLACVRTADSHAPRARLLREAEDCARTQDRERRDDDKASADHAPWREQEAANRPPGFGAASAPRRDAAQRG